MFSVVLAGGFGKRLNPISTDCKPKQFHDLLGTGDTLLQDTIKRAQEFTKNPNIITIGNIAHRAILEEQIKSIDPKINENNVFEPLAKNTGASVYLAAKVVKSGIMVILPSDHYVSGDFTNSVIQATEVAKQGKIVTFGIKPTGPNTNYGYIVENQFFEKPEVAKAEWLIERGAFWNSGIFVAEAATILEEYKKYAPEYIDSSFTDMPSLPFDKAIMEKTDKVDTIAADFEWDDLGNIESLKKYSTLPDPATA